MTGNVKMKTMVKLQADAHCPSHSLSKISIRDLEVLIDEPVERGGSNMGPTPTDAALAALVGCTNVIAHKCASHLQIDTGNFDISALCDFDRRGVTLAEEIDVPFQTVRLTIKTGKPVSQADLQRLSQEVAKFCPLSKLFKQAGTAMEEEWISV